MRQTHGSYERIDLVDSTLNDHLSHNRLVDNFVKRKFLPPHLKSSASRAILYPYVSPCFAHTPSERKAKLFTGPCKSSGPVFFLLFPGSGGDYLICQAACQLCQVVKFGLERANA